MPEYFLPVTSIQRMCLQDGPGVRTTVFLKGCYLQCPWCCNPETISIKQEYLYNKSRCNLYREKKFTACLSCELNEGERHKEACPFKVFIPASYELKPEELTDKLLKDINLYKNSGGGVTFSGGEPCMHAEALLPILQKLKEQKIHIVFETSCYFPHEYLSLIKHYVDLFYVDVKFQYGLTKNTEFHIPTSSFEDNLRELQHSGKEIIYRMVYIAEAFDDKKKYHRIIKQLHNFNIFSLELLCYHSLAQNKYDQLGKIVPDFSIPTEEKIEEFIQVLHTHLITTQLYKIL